MITKEDMKIRKEKEKRAKKVIVAFLKKHRNNYYTANEISNEIGFNIYIVESALWSLWAFPFNLIRKETVRHETLFAYGY